MALRNRRLRLIKKFVKFYFNRRAALIFFSRYGNMLALFF